ncbi:MAG: hypothetical protein ACLQF0_16940 [Dissulfurispiraceae bacterium]
MEDLAPLDASSISHQERIYEHILDQQQTPDAFISGNYRQLLGHCRKHYTADAEDVLNAACTVIVARARRKRITFCTWWYFARTAKAAFRAILCQRKSEASYEELHEQYGLDIEAPMDPTLDERIEMLRDDYRFTDPINQILEGVNLTQACSNYQHFLAFARLAAAGQMTLFSRPGRCGNIYKK